MQKWWHSPIARLVKKFFRVYYKTLTINITGLEKTKAYIQEHNAIFLLWHDSLFFAPIIEQINAIRPLNVLISKSRDGNFVTAFAQSFLNTTVTRVGHLSRYKALHTSIHRLHMGQNLLITPDGPRGPKRVIKPGALFAAQKTGVSIIPIVVSCSKAWSLHSWDQFQIPQPFTSVQCTFLLPIEPTQHLCVQSIQARML